MRRAFAFVIVALLCVSTLSAGPILVGAEPDTRLTDLLRHGMFGDALAVAQRDAARDPGNETAHGALAIIYGLDKTTRRNCEEEIGILKAQAPDAPSLKMAEALLAWQDQNLEGALKLGKEAINKDQDNPIFYALVGQFYLSKKDPESAEKKFRQGWEIEPDCLQNAMPLARLLAARGRMDEASDILKKVQTTHANSPEPRILLAEMYLQAGRPDLAEMSFRKALALNPADHRVRQALCDLYRSSKSYDLLKAAAEEGLRQPVPFPRGDYYLGLVAAAGEDMKSALIYLKKASESTEKIPQVPYFMGAALLTQNDLKGALAAFDKALEINKAFRPALHGKVVVDLMQKSPSSAVKQLEDMIARDDETKGSDRAGLFYLACAALANGDRGKAVGYFRKASGIVSTYDIGNTAFTGTLAPDSAPGIAAAAFYSGLGWPEQALSQARAVLAKAPGNILAEYFQVRGLRDKGQWALAERSAYEIARQDPSFLPAHLELVQICTVLRDWSLVRREQREILRLKPGDELVRRALATDSLGTRQYDEVVALANDGLLCTPPFDLAHYFLGEVCARLNNFDKAIENFREFADAFPRSPEPLYLIGLACLGRNGQGDTQKASDAFAKARKIDPDFTPVLIAQAVMAGSAKGDEKSPAKELERLAAQHQETPLGSFVLANIYLASAERGKAELAYKRASGFTGGLTELNTSFIESTTPVCAIRLNVVALFLSVNWRQKALEQIGRLTGRDAINPLVLCMKATVYQQENVPGEAIAALKNAIEVNPKFLPAYFQLADLYQAMNRTNDVNAVLAQAAQNDQENPVLHLQLANSYYARKKLPEALSQYNTVLLYRPNDIVALNQAACVLLESGKDLPRALEMARKAEQLAPAESAAPFKDTVGWIYCAQRDYENAIGKLKEAVDAAPQQPTIVYHLGMAYARAGKKPEAIACLKRALVLSSDFPEVKDAGDMLAELEKK